MVYEQQMLYRFHVGHEGFMVLWGHVFNRVTDLVNDAQLHLCLRINAVYRLREAGQPAHAGDQDVFNAPVLQVA